MTREQMEARRMQARELFAKGLNASQVSRKLQVSRTSTSRWFRTIKTGKSLKLRKAPGRPSRLTPRQQEFLRDFVHMNPEMTDIEVRELIRSHAGVLYDRDHAGRLKTYWLGLRPQLGFPRKGKAA